jgi:parvulin-like peptidyl-prolyl isomerase
LTTRRMLALSLVILLIFPLALAACGEKKPEPDKVVAVVNGEELARENFEMQLEQMKNSYAMMGLDVSDADSETLNMIQQQVLDDMINTLILLQQAKETGLDIDTDIIDAEIDKIKDSFEDEEAFNEALENAEITLKDLEDSLMDSLLLDKYIKENINSDDVEATDEEIQDLYDLYYGSAEDAPEFEEVAAQLKMQLIQDKSSQLLNILIEDLRAQSEIEILL